MILSINGFPFIYTSANCSIWFSVSVGSISITQKSQQFLQKEMHIGWEQGYNGT